MKTFRSYTALPYEARGAVLVIGNFDGVHRGHRFVLEEARVLAARENAKLGVLTFEPHPRALFRPDDPPARLTPLPLKAQQLESCGVDFLYAVSFDWDFASQTAEDFIVRVLQRGLEAKHVIVGEDFRFGQLRKGTPADIMKAGLAVTLLPPQKENGEIISSSLIRQALRHGEIEKANVLLGWDWEIWGEVIKGDRRGGTLGYPTANFALGETVHPAYGVYAAFVNIEGEAEWRGAAVNIGIRPMFEIPEAQVESYIFDFTREIYGRTLRVRLIERLRSEARFNSVEELVKQIDNDCSTIREILKRHR